MHAQGNARRFLAALAAPLVLTGVLSGLGPAAAAATCHSWTGIQPPNRPGATSNELDGVAVLSPCNAWAVGSADGTQDLALIEHWDGASWKLVPSPNPGSNGNFLSGVRAVSPTSIWAVGTYSIPNQQKTLILHWDGHHWVQAANVPSPGQTAELSGVRVVSARDVWAVGDYRTGTVDKTLILHWNGRTWARVPSPSPGPSSELASVAATSRSDAWAVGRIFGSSIASQTLILHWNGRRWTRAASPNPAGFSNNLNAVGVTSARNAWAVGGSSGDVTGQTLILRWNGRTWARVASPNLPGAGTLTFLSAVTATSARNAWAVGAAFPGGGQEEQTFIVRWKGSVWKQVPSPSLATFNDLIAVGASSASNVWAVGSFNESSGLRSALALHCC
jgi:hypothetical protein